MYRKISKKSIMPYALCALLFACLLQAQAGEVSIQNGRLVPKLLNYQGYLTDSTGVPIDDSLDMTFKIFDAASSGNELWSETQTNVPVERGVFSVILGEGTPIPDSVFADFASTWLELTLAGTQTLTPRTRITSVGYAYTSTYTDTAEYAKNATADNDWTLNNDVLYTGSYWGIARGGAGNTLYGDSARTHINLGKQSTTGTSGQHYYNCTVGGGFGNTATKYHATVSGGRYNVASGTAATVSGGDNNDATHDHSTVGGGQSNTAGNVYATIGGGVNNTVSSWDATVGGGRNNTISGYAGVIAGGYENSVAGDYSAICGGRADTITATAHYSFLFGIASKLTADSTFMVDMPHIRFGTEASGYEFPTADGVADQVMVTDGSGQLSWSTAADDNDWAVTDSVLYTGKYWGIARGGAGNVLLGDATHTHVNLGVNSTAGDTGYVNCTVSGGIYNTANRTYATVGGGRNNNANNVSTTVGGGRDNSATGGNATIAGGYRNEASGTYATVGGGYDNTASSFHATVSGGNSNTAGNAATVSGGYGNTASPTGNGASIGGGYNNYVDGDYGVIPGGYDNTITADADYSYLFGINSNLTQDSTVMIDMPHIHFGDETNGYEFPSSDGSANQILATNGTGQLRWSAAPSDSDWVISGSNMYSNVSGNVGIGTASPSQKLHVQGNARITGALYDSNNEAGTSGQVLSTTGSGIDWIASPLDGDWTFLGNDVLITGGEWGIARSGNVMYGDNDSTYVNLGVACTTGTNGHDFSYCTVNGGCGNMASRSYATVGGGGSNTASNNYATVGGGRVNIASGYVATVGGGDLNLASNNYATVAGGAADTASGWSSFATNHNSNALHHNSTACNGQATTADNQTRVGVLSKASGSFTIDHPLDPENKILNHYFVESPDMSNIYSGSVVLDADGRAQIDLPDYFDALNRNPRVQLTGVGSADVVYVAEEFKSNQFTIGGKPGMKIYWTVIADRKDPSAEITKIIMPVEQPKDGDLAGRSLDDDFLCGTMLQLEQMGKAGQFQFRTAAARQRYREMKKMIDN